MPTWAIILIVVAIAAAGVLAWFFMERQRRSRRLRAQFGPEYDRLVREHHDRRRAERELQMRESRVQRLEIRSLGREERERYIRAWRAQQERFVDDPKTAVFDADRLVTDVMKARGYPMADFEQRAADISVDHPHVVQNYRVAREIVAAYARGDAGTEDLRKAMVCYRALFDELLELQEVKR
jgi:FtsZ-interacting cell division protein ZipA